MAANDTNRGDEDSPVTGNVLHNDSDPDGDPLTVTHFTVDADGDGKPDSFNAGDTVTIKDSAGDPIGDLTVNRDGSYTFTPTPNWNGDVPTVDYTVTDGEGGTDHGKLNITIDPVDDIVEVNVPTDQSAGTPDGNTADQVVFESGLADGSDPSADDTKVESSFTVKVPDGLDDITLTYTDKSGTPQTLTLTKADVEALGDTPKSIDTEYGTLELNDYSRAPDGTLTIDYSYTLTTPPGYRCRYVGSRRYYGHRC